MRNTILSVFLLLLIHTSQAQVTYVSLPNVVGPTPQANSVNLSTNNSTEFRGYYDITLTPGFDVTQSSNTNTSKYFLGYIEYGPVDIQYALLAKEFTSGYAPTTNGVLYFAYDEKYNTGALNYQIYDYMHTPLITPAIKNTLNLTRNIGKNFFQIYINAIGLTVNSEAQKYFTLEVINDKNEKFVLRFKHP